MDVEEDAGRVVGRGGHEVRGTLVGEDRPQVALDRLDLGFGVRRRSAEGRVAGRRARAAAAPPLEGVVAVEVDAAVGRVGAEVVVDVLAPGESGLRLLAAVGVRLQQQVNLVVVEQPGGVGVAAVAGDELLGEAGGELGRRVLAGVDRGGREQLRLRTRDVGVGESQDPQVVAGRLALRLEPRVPDVDHRRQVGVRGDDRVHRRVGLLDRAVAGEGGDRRRTVETRLAGHPGGAHLVDFDVEAERAERRHPLGVGLDQQEALVAVVAEMIAPGRDRAPRGRVAEPGADHPGSGSGGALARGERRSRCTEQNGGEETRCNRAHGVLERTTGSCAGRPPAPRPRGGGRPRSRGSTLAARR